jgi:hypothetical protein
LLVFFFVSVRLAFPNTIPLHPTHSKEERCWKLIWCRLLFQRLVAGVSHVCSWFQIGGVGAARASREWFEVSIGSIISVEAIETGLSVSPVLMKEREWSSRPADGDTRAYCHCPWCGSRTRRSFDWGSRMYGRKRVERRFVSTISHSPGQPIVLSASMSALQDRNFSGVPDSGPRPV